MAFFLKILKWIVKYGSKGIKWAWAHKWQIITWGSAAYDIIKSIFG